MNLLYPKLRWSWLPAMLGYSLLGAFLAGLYGILHDQVTYSICPEYFTRFKFVQFHYADFGWPPRILVGEIGFLATWWVGFIAAWFLARVTVAAFPPGQALRYTLRGFVIVFHRENTRASVTMRWSIEWLSNDRLGLESSDIGTYYWKRQPDGVWKKE